MNNVFKTIMLSLSALLIAVSGQSCEAETSASSLGGSNKVKQEYLGQYTLNLPEEVPTSYTYCRCSISEGSNNKYKVTSTCYGKDTGRETHSGLVPVTVIDGNDFASVPIPSMNNDYVFAWVRPQRNGDLELVIVSKIDDNHRSPSELRQYIRDRLTTGLPYVYKLYLRKN